MKNEFIHLTNKNINRIFYDESVKSKSTNDASITRMKKILHCAIQKELTEKQKLCLIEYYLNGKKEKDIALEQNISPSTVSRHITKAKQKLRHIASFYVN